MIQCTEVTNNNVKMVTENVFRDKDESIKLEKTRKREMDEALKDRKKYCLYPSGLVAKVKLWDAIKVEKMKNEGERKGGQYYCTAKKILKKFTPIFILEISIYFLL